MPKRRVEGEIAVACDAGPSTFSSLRSPVDSPQSACSSSSRSNLRQEGSWDDKEPLLPVHTKQASSSSQRTLYGSFLRRRGSHGDEDQKPANLPLVDTSGSLNVERRGVPKLTAYWGDLFHTLINIPNIRFYPLLLLGYSLLFGGFALPYYHQSIHYNCIPGVKTYWHALWFSVQSAMTIGFGGDLVPDPDCFTLNLLIALQSLAALIVAYALLGIVYTRFALPSRRASSLVFSQHMVLNEEDGVPRLSFRVANVRKHQLIEAHAQLLVAINNIMTKENEALFKFSNLPILGGGFVFLALPCIITHAITKHSPLHGMSLAMMERADLEFLVLIEGVDAPTSAKLQARHSYSPRDIKFNHRFCTMVRRSPSGVRRVDFTKFHDTQPVPATLRRPHFLPHTPSWENLGNLSNLSSLSSLPSVLRQPTAVSTDKSGGIWGRKDAPPPYPHPPDPASASLASCAYPLAIAAAGPAAAAAAAEAAASGASTTIPKNSSFMNILSLGLGAGSGWGSGVWGGGVAWGSGVWAGGGWGSGVWKSSGGAAGAEQPGTAAGADVERPGMVTGRGLPELIRGPAAGDVIPSAAAAGGAVGSITAAAADSRGQTDDGSTSDVGSLAGSGASRLGRQGRPSGGMFLPLAGLEHDLSLTSLPPVIEGGSGCSSPASGPPGAISGSGGFNSSWGAARERAWSVEAAGAVTGAVLSAPVAAAAQSLAMSAGAAAAAAAAAAGVNRETAARVPGAEEQMQTGRMARRGSGGRSDGVPVRQGLLGRRVSFELSSLRDSGAGAEAESGAEVAAGGERLQSAAGAVALLDDGLDGRRRVCRESAVRAEGEEDEGVVGEFPCKKGRREQRALGGKEHGRGSSEGPIPVPRGRRNSAPCNSSTRMEIGANSRKGGSVAGSGLPGSWTDQSPLLLMNSFSVRSASHMLEMDARHRVAVAEKREQQWRSLVVDLASKVQSSNALHAPDVDSHPLLNRAKEFLDKAIAEDANVEAD